MKRKCITVQEYKKIVLSPGDKEGDNDNKKLFDELCQFVDDFTGAKNVEDDVSLFIKKGKDKQGTFVQIMNYVGLIQLPNGHQIDILPKIYFTNSVESNSYDITNKYSYVDVNQKESDDIKITKKIFVDMFCTLKNIKKAKVLRNGDLEVKNKPIFEIYISMFLSSLNELIKKGLRSIYLNKLENVSFFKGKLMINQHIKHNIVHKEKFYTQFDEFSYNRVENRLLKSTLVKLLKISKDAKNIQNIKEDLVFFDLVDTSINYKNDFKKVMIDKSTKEYDELLKWAEVFLDNKSFITFSGSHGAKALLYKMNDLFESYVAKRIRNVFGDTYEIKTQSTSKKLFDNPQKFTLRPDIVLRDKFNNTIIMDTKWKKLINDERKNYGISQMDMYQMFAYSIRYACGNANKLPKVYLLYPSNSLERVNKNYLSSTKCGDVNIETFMINFTDEKPYIDDSLKELKEKISKSKNE